MTQLPLTFIFFVIYMLVARNPKSNLDESLDIVKNHTFTLISLLLFDKKPDYMDQWKPKLEFHQHQYIPNDRREMTEVEVKDTNEARKVQKADREKLRRDRLNEQFIELGNVLDPDRPKNDKASIIIDTIQVLKDLTTEVTRLKAECRALSEESSELTQEKNELREEKSSLKSDIENLNAQYQQRVRVMFPWGAIDHSSVVMPTTLPTTFQVALPVHTGPIPMHPFPFFTNHNPPGSVPTPAPAFIPYSNQTIPVYANVAPTSYSSSKHGCGSKSSDHSKGNSSKKGDNSSDVVTELELKTPGSRSGQGSSGGDKKGKQLEGGCSSSRQTTSSSSVVDNNGGV